MNLLRNSPLLRKAAGWFVVNKRWVSEQPAFWLTLSVLIAAFWYIISAKSADDSQDRLRYAGTILQLGGVITVAVGVESTRKLFGHPRTLNAFFFWLRRWPWRGSWPIMGSIRATVEPATARLVGSNLSATVSGNSLEGRVTALEENLKFFGRELAALTGKLDSTATEHKAALSAERVEREQSTNRISQLLETAQTGGLSLTMAGVVWLTFGIVFATIPGELARWWGFL